MRKRYTPRGEAFRRTRCGSIGAGWCSPITLTAGIRAQNLPMPGKPSDNLAAAKVFDYASLAVTRNPNGSERRDVVSSGRLATGEPVHIHASMQPPGIPPGRAHTIEHSEFIVVTEGTLEVTFDGRPNGRGRAA